MFQNPFEMLQSDKFENELNKKKYTGVILKINVIYKLNISKSCILKRLYSYKINLSLIVPFPFNINDTSFSFSVYYHGKYERGCYKVGD